MNRLREKYLKEVQPKLKEELKLTTVMSVPRLDKIVINVGLGEAKDNAAILEKVVKDLRALAGQKPVVTKAKKSISNFKLSKGQSIGAKVTLRNERMYQFLDKLMSIVLPKVRDFRGLPTTPFDGRGNYTLGLKEQALFPEVSVQSTGEKTRGLEVSIITTADSQEQGKRLLELLGMPFKKG